MREWGNSGNTFSQYRSCHTAEIVLAQCNSKLNSQFFLFSLFLSINTRYDDESVIFLGRFRSSFEEVTFCPRRLPENHIIFNMPSQCQN